MESRFERAVIKVGNRLIDPTLDIDQLNTKHKKERSNIGQLGHTLICSGAVIAAAGLVLDVAPVSVGVIPRLAVFAGAGLAVMGGAIKLTELN